MLWEWRQIWKLKYQIAPVFEIQIRFESSFKNLKLCISPGPIQNFEFQGTRRSRCLHALCDNENEWKYVYQNTPCYGVDLVVTVLIATLAAPFVVNAYGNINDL